MNNSIRKAIWASMNGCSCPSQINGMPIRIFERCTSTVVRCDERLARIRKEIKELEERENEKV